MKSPTHSIFGRTAADSSLSFPVIDMEPERGQWPLPPFNWRHAPPPEGVAQPCTIETLRGTLVQGEMMSFDPTAGRLLFRSELDKSTGYVRFRSMRRLTLTAPLTAAPRGPRAPLERVPAAAQEREYRLELPGANTPQMGQTVGHVETDAGLFLFAPLEEETSLRRVFIPREAYIGVTFGQSVEERAAARWISTPDVLLLALERQRSMPVLPIGEALLNLGLVTPSQLDRALADQRGNVPLGEMLVCSGVISRSNLEAAIAHKMGYPLVDLTRFPVEEAAARMLQLRVACECFAMPLMIRERNLIVAVDRPSRATKLHTLRALAELTIVPVLAPKNQIMVALGELAQRDAWSTNVFSKLVFPPTVY
jgi:hypothetical protein